MTQGQGGGASHFRKGTFTEAAGARFRIKGIMQKQFSPKTGYFSEIFDIFLPNHPKITFYSIFISNFPKIFKIVFKIYLRCILRREKPLFLQYFPVEQRAIFAPRCPAKQRARGGGHPLPRFRSPCVEVHSTLRYNEKKVSTIEAPQNFFLTL